MNSMNHSNPSHPAPGDIGAPFWQGLRERRLMLQFDTGNGRAQFCPRPQSLYSEAKVEWREASGRGVIAALTLSHVAPPHLADAVPYVLALVGLDEGPRIVARVNAPYESLSIGHAVEVDWDASCATTSAMGATIFPIFKPTRGDSP